MAFIHLYTLRKLPFTDKESSTKKRGYGIPRNENKRNKEKKNKKKVIQRAKGRTKNKKSTIYDILPITNNHGKQKIHTTTF